MDWFWTWGGECFGYRREDRLYAYHGLQVGRFYGDEVFGADGKYLGEIKGEKRLITNLGKKAASSRLLLPPKAVPMPGTQTTQDMPCTPDTKISRLRMNFESAPMPAIAPATCCY